MCQCQRQQSIIEGFINDIKDLTSKNAEMTIRFKMLQMENDSLKKKLEQLENCKDN